MPQLILEYSSNIKAPANFKELFLKCHRILESVGAIRISNCKSRAVKRDVYLVGDGTNPHEAFVHLDLSFAAERNLDIKQRIGREILKVLEDHFPKSNDLQITVKITSIEKETYFKIPEGTFSP
jgi:5-carboxymethyl-2-hydroxymuconate isomerase